MRKKALFSTIVCILIAGLCCLNRPVEAQKIKFSRFTIEDGLSQNTINCTIQDKKGFLWFGTQDGLNCWDGYTFTVYRHDPDDSTSLSHSYVWSIYQDKQGRLWIGTLSGLNLFNPRLKIFERFHCVPKNLQPKQVALNNSVRAIAENNAGQLILGTYGGGLRFFNPNTKTFEDNVSAPIPASLSDNKVFSVFAEKDGTLWAGTDGGGLNRFNPKTKIVEQYKNDPRDTTSLSNNKVYSVYRDHSGRLWACTSNGLNLFDPKSNTFERFLYNPGNSFSLSNNSVYSIYEDKKGRLWIGKLEGLYLFDPVKKTFRVFRNIPGESTSLSDNNVHSIIETRNGQLIVGTYGGGINVLDGRAKQFTSFSNDPSDPTTLSDNIVWSIYEDSNNRLWVGTNKGINLFNANHNTFENHRQHTTQPFWLPDQAIRSIAEDNTGRLWVGTQYAGLFILDIKAKKSEHLQNVPGNHSSLPNNRVISLYQDKAGNMWVGTNKGLSIFNSATKTFTTYINAPDDPHSPLYNTINVIEEDSENLLRLGTNGGICLFNTSTKSFINYKHNPNDTSSISSNYACSILEDHHGRLWIGTDAGLNLFDSHAQSFRVFHYEISVPNDLFYAVLEDDKGRLWCSTNKGILCFTPATDFAPEKGRWGDIRNYTVTDGIQNNEFNSGAYFKGKDAKMYFGGINGFTVFHPDSIKEDITPPPVFLTDLEIFNKPVMPGKTHNNFALHEAITEAEELVLSYRESVFTIKFSALSFAQADKNQYAYMLEGFDQDWVYTHAQKRFATYTNLDPGTYTFRVKGSNRDGIWNEKGASLKIVIIPPWWKTWWFSIILSSGVIGVVVSIIAYRTREIRQINQALTQTVEQKTKELNEKNQALLKQEKEIIAQNKELLRQTIKLEEKNIELEKAKGLLEMELKYLHQRQLLKLSVDVQEEERKRIAQDLHDELGAVLSIARMHLVQVQNKNPDINLTQNLQQAQTLTETALATMRRISHELMPPQLEKYGLIKTLEALAGQINAAKKINVDLTTPNNQPRWPMPIELGLYRIAMEMINNTLKHAEANQIHIHLMQTSEYIVFIYVDDGKGLPINYIEGHGFKNIDARTNALGGTIEYGKTTTGFGATLTVPKELP